MIALDTNVLIRFLVRDDHDQAARAHALIESCAEKGEECLITSSVLCETECVLESVYRASRAEIANAVRMLLTTPPFSPQDPAILENALQRYSKGKGDLSDYLIGECASALGARTTYTFDRVLRNAEQFTLL